MVAFTILSLLSIVAGLVVYCAKLQKQHKAQLKNQFRLQQKQWTTKYSTLQDRIDELETRDRSIKDLRLEKRILKHRLHITEDKRDSLLASLAALDTQESYDRCEVLERENENLTEKVVSLHKNNTEIRIKLDTYKNYAKQRDLETSAASQEALMEAQSI